MHLEFAKHKGDILITILHLYGYFKPDLFFLL